MISKSSFCDFGLLREALRRNLWAFALALLGLFCALPLPVTMIIQNAAGKIAQGTSAATVHADTLQILQRFIGIENILVKVVMTALAVICGISMFSYLHSRQQVDFYHSLPVRRSTLFRTNYAAGLIIVMPLYLIMTAIAAVVTSVSGYDAAVVSVGAGIATDLVFFLVLYTLSVLCTILCGHRVVSLLLLAWSAVSVSVALGLFVGVQSAFYHTFSAPSSLVATLISRLSPIVQYVSVSTVLAKQGYNHFTDSTLSAPTSLPFLLLGYLLVAAALLILSYVLFSNRRSERAGSAIAFQGLKTPLKLWCVTVMALGVGVLLHAICDTTGFTWLYFGFAFGGILTHFLMEIIYAFDFKAIFSHLKTLVIYAIVFVAVIVCMKVDVTGFDRYLPSADSLQGVRISATGEDTYTSPNWGSRSLSEIDNVQQVLRIAGYGIEHNVHNTPAKDGDTYRSVMELNVTFVKKSGTMVTRTYTVPYQADGEINGMLQKVTYSPEYLSKCLPVFTYDLTDHDLLRVVSERKPDSSSAAARTTDPAVIRKILYTLRRETLALTASQGEREAPVLCLDLSTYDPLDGPPKDDSIDYNASNSSGYMPIYANFTDTLTLLKDDLGVVPTSLTPADVKSFNLTLYTTVDTHQTSSSDSVKTNASRSVDISNSADIAQILRNVSSLTAYNSNYPRPKALGSVTLNGKEYQLNVSLSLKDGTAISTCFPEGHLPMAVFQKYFR